MKMRKRKTLGIGQIVSEENTLIKSMLKLGQHRLLDGKKRKANKRETEKKKATRSCRKSTKSI